MTIKSALLAGALTLAMATLTTAPASAMPNVGAGLTGAETLAHVEKAHWRHGHHHHWHHGHHRHWRHWHHRHHHHWH